jgi:hypothetical protein
VRYLEDWPESFGENQDSFLKSKQINGLAFARPFAIIIYMKFINRLGLGILGAGLLILIGFGLYKFAVVFLKDASVPLLIKVGVFGVFLGIIIILISFIFERIKEAKKEI